MKEVTVDLTKPSFYVEPDSGFYRWKRKITYRTVLRILRRSVGKDKAFSLLEIGTGSGFLLSFLEEEFPKSRLAGLEYDPRLVDVTKSRVKTGKITQGSAEEFNLNDSFDIIVSLQVIEHLYHPELMLAAVRKHLKPGGVFIFTSPNPSGLSAKVMKKKWHGYREDHVSMKGCDEWSQFLEQNGFTPVYRGSTFFSGIPILNRLPLGVVNWVLLFLVGSLRWKHGESFVGVFKLSDRTAGYKK